jgi:hypothetical protein
MGVPNNDRNESIALEGIEGIESRQRFWFTLGRNIRDYWEPEDGSTSTITSTIDVEVDS